MVEFEEFPKMARLFREIIISEKIDGTNGTVFIQSASLETDRTDNTIIGFQNIGENEYSIRAGSRNKWITPGKTSDNSGFAAWVQSNLVDLVNLGEGWHRGEWWGSGIQRGYNLPKGEKRFSLFNTYRWADDGTDVRPSCCHVVPVLYKGPFDTAFINSSLTLLAGTGSVASPGFMNPEGIITWHTAGNVGYKTTIKNDESPKSLVK